MSGTKAEVETKPEVRIHIDQQPHHSPNPTTGDALYALGQVQPGLDLFFEVSGDREDPEVPRGSEVVHLKQDEHFHSGPPEVKKFDIIVNTRKKVVTTREVSFNQIVALAFDSVPVGPNILFTITYRRGPHANPEGHLLEGGTVKVKNGMVFNVRATDKS
jgi:hypothetical protein